MMYLYVIGISVIAGICGRLGGTSAGTLWRDIGVPLCGLILMLLLGRWHWSLLICAVLTYGSCTTYFKRKGQDALWFNWLFVGLAFSLSMLPYAWATGHWVEFIYRSLACTIGVVGWNLLIGKDWLEEGGRYFIIVSTLFLL
jgi:hypothetical protein